MGLTLDFELSKELQLVKEANFQIKGGGSERLNRFHSAGSQLLVFQEKLICLSSLLCSTKQKQRTQGVL